MTYNSPVATERASDQNCSHVTGKANFPCHSPWTTRGNILDQWEIRSVSWQVTTCEFFSDCSLPDWHNDTRVMTAFTKTVRYTVVKFQCLRIQQFYHGGIAHGSLLGHCQLSVLYVCCWGLSRVDKRLSTVGQGGATVSRGHGVAWSCDCVTPLFGTVSEWE